MPETGIKPKVIEEICNFAEKNHVKKVILFGSRARGDYQKKRDIDIAVEGGNFNHFARAGEEETSTLLEYDIVNLDQKVSKALQESIRREGVVIYEKI